MTKRTLLFTLAMVAGLPALAQDHDNVATVLEGGALVRRNGIYFNNRPLYAAQENPDQRYYWVFAGDKPLVRQITKTDAAQAKAAEIAARPAAAKAAVMGPNGVLLRALCLSDH